MDTIKICRLGYFDRVMIDGYSMPMYNGRGIEIKTNCSLIESLDSNIDLNAQGLGKIKVTIVGEALSNDDIAEEIERMQKHREDDLGLERVKIGNIDRYIIAYADILILKSDESLPSKLTNKGNTLEDIEKLAKGEDKLNLMSKGLDIQSKLVKNNKDANVALIDKVFVHKEFRRCGISKWIHNNIKDIIKIYGLIDVGAALLIPGDFTNSAERDFEMSKDYYEEVLTEHYKNVGYTMLGNGVMCKDLNKTKFNLRDLLIGANT